MHSKSDNKLGRAIQVLLADECSSEDMINGTQSLEAFDLSEIGWSEEHVVEPKVKELFNDTTERFINIASFSSHDSATTSLRNIENSMSSINVDRLHSLDALILALNTGDLYSLFDFCQRQCSFDVLFESKQYGFQHSGTVAVTMFWTLMFAKHSQGKVQLLQQRVNSTLKGVSRSTRSKGLESVDFVVKLEGVRVTEFLSFHLYKALMNCTALMTQVLLLSAHEVICLVGNFHQAYLQQRLADPAHDPLCSHAMVYLFEINLKFHELHPDIITHWTMELIAVQDSPQKKPI